ncbi:aminotransferase class V-fold PLP-dependent enzyme [Geobacillus vulcani]|uniref:aminotransferase class V-fold PLP-dependent enzyme n=1 Tax=Geobacillus vulcani TaxID=135517 RepID=UPI0004DF914B|nr:aminotransferase class V-fold PLP-dependent enzyme [Geobacillus vulcani]
MTIHAAIGNAVYTCRGELETYFQPFREGTIGRLQPFSTPFGEQRLIYADWTASGRLYRPIEEKLTHELGPFVGNTHTESNVTGTKTTLAYRYAKEMIKQHVHAGKNDVLIMQGAGTTSAVNKLQRLLGLRVPERWKHRLSLADDERPIVFVTHMEHHSNLLPWVETIAEVITIRPTAHGDVDLNHLRELLERYKDRPQKIGAFTACSNVTGLETSYHQMARLMHEYGGLCFVDFAASAPYVHIDMHPDDPMEQLDAIYFSPHKFLGGPGSAGVLIFDSRLYHQHAPDHPGGGTVYWTDPWGNYEYIQAIEEREDGGTPPFWQTIKAALAIQLKEQMNVKQMRAREKELVSLLLPSLKSTPGVRVLEGHRDDRLGIISFVIDGLHYNLVVKLLNDRFGIQARGGCSCAGPYGHYLLGIDKEQSAALLQEVKNGNPLAKPGWVRLSLHPTMTNEEVYAIIHAIRQIVRYGRRWQEEYEYDAAKNEFVHRNDDRYIRHFFLF